MVLSELCLLRYGVVSQRLISLLLSALHYDRRNFDAPLVATLDDGEWAEFLDLARHHRVRPALLNALNGPAAGVTVAPDRLAALSAECRQIAARNLLFQAETSKHAFALQQRGVPVLLLKGMHLATDVYSSSGLREMSDIDLLVDHAHLEAAAGVLREAGYEPVVDVPVATGVAAGHHLSRMIKPGVAGFEIHWTIAAPDTGLVIDPQGLWARAKPVKIGPAKVLTLGPDDLLLHLCLHATHQHVMEMGLRPLCDLTVVIERYRDELDWDAIQRRARSWRCARGVYIALELGSRLIGVPAPAGAIHSLRPTAANTDAVLAVSEAHLFARPQGLPPSSPPLSRLIAHQPWRARLRHFISRVVLPPEVLASIYGFDHAAPWHMHSRYQLLRIVHLFQRHSRTALRLLLKSDPETVLRAQRQNALGDWLAARDPE